MWGGFTLSRARAGVHVALLASLLALAGCTSLPRNLVETNAGGAALPEAAALSRESLRLARAGSESLRGGRFSEANGLFNRALRLEPENAQLHFLNALAYHLGWRVGEQRDPELAETGYLVALQLDPTLGAATGQLGVLYTELKRHDAASGALAKAIALRPQDAEVHYALAHSAYYERDVGLAAWAARRAVVLAPGNADYLKAAALASAAAGDSAGAAGYFQDVEKLVPRETAPLRAGIERWQSVHTQLGRDLSGGAALPPVKLAQGTPPFPSQPFPAGPAPYPGPSNVPGQAAMTGGEVPLQRKWSDCEQERVRTMDGGQRMGGGSGGPSGGADETTPLPALPSPCKGLPLPRMAMVDVTILRTEEMRSSAHGVNLLEGLQVVLTGSRSVSRTTTGSPQRQVTQTGAFALPSAGIAYALNLANASDKHSEIIARPTLAVLDRTPSLFFSGSNVSVVISGTLSGGSISEKPIGVSLSVTPTFVDDDTMLLAVKATRSFIEAGSPGTFQQALATTRNTVTANVLLKFDQTLVLSGLRERDQQETDTGVPLLRDLPGIQYLFARRTTQDFTKEVVVTITPRRPAQLGDAVAAAARHLQHTGVDERGRQALDKVKREAQAGGAQVTNLSAIFAALSDNRFWFEFRTGDISTARIQNNFSLERVLREVWESLLF